MYFLFTKIIIILYHVWHLKWRWILLRKINGTTNYRRTRLHVSSRQPYVLCVLGAAVPVHRSQKLRTVCNTYLLPVLCTVEVRTIIHLNRAEVLIYYSTFYWYRMLHDYVAIITYVDNIVLLFKFKLLYRYERTYSLSHTYVVVVILIHIVLQVVVGTMPMTSFENANLNKNRHLFLASSWRKSVIVPLRPHSLWNFVFSRGKCMGLYTTSKIYKVYPPPPPLFADFRVEIIPNSTPFPN